VFHSYAGHRHRGFKQNSAHFQFDITEVTVGKEKWLVTVSVGTVPPTRALAWEPGERGLPRAQRETEKTFFQGGMRLIQ
jgi:hypothetical protein